MIDTIRMISRKYNKSNLKLLKHYEKYVEYSRTETSYFIYRYGNISVILTETKMIIYGSLTKHFLGHNINLELGSVKDVKAAITKLSEELSINLSEFIITRLDIGRCYIMKHPVVHYLNGLRSLPRHYFI